MFERIGLAPTPPEGHRFHGFISYSHAADGQLATALQKGLQRFAKPWYRARALRIFRDDASMDVTANLWRAIEQALADSEHYILLASPLAASSEWVAKEAEQWTRTKPVHTLLVALTDGELVWDRAGADFDWHRTTALPAVLRGVFQDEPRFVDLRWARSVTDLSLDHPRFREAIADLAAPLHGRPKDELAGEEVLQQRRAVRIRRFAAAALVTLTAAAVVAGVLASIERGRAVSELRATQSQLLAGQAVSARDLPLAAVLATEAYRISPTVDARSAVLTVADNPAYGRVLVRTSRAVDRLAYSPNGRTLATGSNNGLIQLWDARSGRPIGRPISISKGAEGVDGLAFTPDGRVLVTSGGIGIQRWSVSSRREIGAPIEDPTGFIGDLVLSPDGRSVAALGNDGRIRFWSLSTGRQSGGQTVPAKPLAFSPDGRTLLASNGHVLLLDTRTDLPVGPAFPGSAGQVGAFSPDGRVVAAAGSGDTIHFWSVASHKPVGKPTAGVGSVITALAFSPDATTLVSAEEDGTLRVWDVATHREIGGPLVGHTLWPDTVAFSPDGQTVASGGIDGTVRLWDVAGRRLGEPIGPSVGVTAMDLSPDGRLLATADGDRIRLWDVATRRQIGTALAGGGHGEYFTSVSFSPDGATLAATSGFGTAGGVVRFWNVAAGKEIGPPITVQGTDETSTVAFSPDGKMVAAAGADQEVRLYDAAGHRQVGALLWIGNGVGSGPLPVDAAVFSPDSKVIAAAYNDGTIRLWNVATRTRVGPTLRGHSGAIGGLAFSPDGRLLVSAGAGDDTVRLWAVATGRQLGAPITDNAEPFNAVAFSPDGATLATAGGDGAVRLWDVATHGQLGAPLYQPQAVTAVAFSPGGRRILAASSDVRVYSDAATGNYVRLLCADFTDAVAKALVRQADPTVAYRRPCPA